MLGSWFLGDTCFILKGYIAFVCNYRAKVAQKNSTYNCSSRHVMLLHIVKIMASRDHLN